jgi:hypothetical protein
MPEHLEACVRALASTPGCEQYGICPNHDGWCAPGCPVGDPTRGGDAASEA